eukprot:5050069-Lingulodinium_polyedra.AAC.1
MVQAVHRQVSMARCVWPENQFVVTQFARYPNNITHAVWKTPNHFVKDLKSANNYRLVFKQVRVPQRAGA